MSQPLRAIPSVDKVLQALGPLEIPRPLALSAVRAALDHFRQSSPVPPFEEISTRIRGEIHSLARSRLQPVINATGVVIHTNLGRSPLPGGQARKVAELASQYSNLEFDLETGERGSRGGYLEKNLALACAAEAAAVVNNCAAALVLILQQFTRERREVLISRGQLVQIGGGFRIPEILESAGAVLREVGTTNRTTTDDYARALSGKTGLILAVHPSNFRMTGFVESAPRAALAELARAAGIPFVEDLGSGAMSPTEEIPPLPHEPMPREVLAAGADLVCFSGDKLFGGPQAGLIAGRTPLVRQLKQNPLFRAFRADKLILAALQFAVETHLGAEEAPEGSPIALLAVPAADLRARAEMIIHEITVAAPQLSQHFAIGSGLSQAGGGTLPECGVESALIEIAGVPADKFASLLRESSPPIIACVANDRVKLDLRTVFPAQDEILAREIPLRLARLKPGGSPP